MRGLSVEARIRCVTASSKTMRSGCTMFAIVDSDIRSRRLERIASRARVERQPSYPFIRIWRRLDAAGSDQCHVRGKEATLILSGSGIRQHAEGVGALPDGRDAIVAGSQVVAVTLRT